MEELASPFANNSAGYYIVNEKHSWLHIEVVDAKTIVRQTVKNARTEQEHGWKLNFMVDRTKDLGSKMGNEFRTQTDSLGGVKVPSDKLWKRSFETMFTLSNIHNRFNV